MTRRFLALLALAGSLALSFLPSPADAAYIVMCLANRPTVAPGPGRYTATASGNVYQLDREGCAPMLATDVQEASANGFVQTGSLRAIILSGASAQAQVGILPPSAYILAVAVQNQGATAPLGGLKFGTTAGGTDVITGINASGNNTITVSSDTSLAKRAFNSTGATNLWVDSNGGWNSAKVIITVLYTFF